MAVVSDDHTISRVPGNVAPTLVLTDPTTQAAADRAAWRALSPEERLDMVERLRLEAGKFLYDYPCRLRKLLAVAGRCSR